MSRHFVPVVFLALISGLALGLIGIVLRSPETHSNVNPEGYVRTPVSYVGTETPFGGIGLADPGLASDMDRGARGRLLFFANSCASCHGLTSRGGVIGPDLDPGEISPSEFRRKVRSGPEGMPAFSEEALSDTAIDDLVAYLKALREEPAPVGE